MWFRRDLRLQDHPALAAAADAGRVVALLALDDALRRAVGSSTAGPFRVFPPFYRMWLAYGRPAPADSDPARISWRRGIGGTGVPQDPRLPARLILPDAGELAAYAA